MELVLFLLVIAVLMLLTIPFAMLIGELENIWENIRFWSIVVAVWTGVIWVAMYA